MTPTLEKKYMKIPTRKTIAAAVLVALALTGCATSPGSAILEGGGDAQGTDPFEHEWVSGPDTAAGEEPVRGGTLRWAQSLPTDILDPHQSSLQGAIQFGRLVADSLVDVHRDTGEVVPWLAESWDISDDGLSYTFVLRDDVTFSDGTALTPDVVKLNFDTIKELGPLSQRGSTFLKYYVESTVDSEANSVTLVLSEPQASLLRLLATPTFAIFAESYVELSPEERAKGHIVGSGPFVVDAIGGDGSGTVVRRDGYAWAPEWWGSDGDAYLDAIEFIPVADSSVLAGSLNSDQIDLYLRLPSQDGEVVLSGGNRIVSNTVAGVPTSLYPNLQSELLQDDAVRVAVSKAIDQEQIVDTILADWFRAPSSALSSTTYGWEDNAALIAADVEGAQQLLEEAGWTVGADGIREKNGERLHLTTYITSNWQNAYEILDLIQQQLLAVGVDFEVLRISTAEGNALRQSGGWDFYYNSNSLGEPDALRQVLAAGPDNWNNVLDAETLGQIDNSALNELNELLDEQARAADESERLALVGDIQKLTLENAFLIPLYDFPLSAGLSSKLHDVIFSRGDVGVHLVRAWISE